MPGSKRRALKKLLSPHSSPHETPSSTSLTSVESGSTTISTIGKGANGSDDPIASDPANYLSDEALREDLEIEAQLDNQKPNNASQTIPAPKPSAVAAPLTGGMYGGFGWNSGGKRGGKKSSKQRFAERQARKMDSILNSAPPTDPSWNAQLERERQDEIAVISGACNVLDCDIFEIQPDGHCMFSAVADQLGLLGVLPAHNANNPYFTRRTAAQYMRDHQDDFLPFLASVDGEDMPGATDDGLMTPIQFAEYCHRVESTAEWGGEPEIQALCRAFKVPIHVIQRGPPTVVSHGGDEDLFGGATTPEKSLAAGPNVVRISYHRRMYGLGEHYNSLRPL